MDYWQEQIRSRLETFREHACKEGFAVSIKLRVSQCFCREHHAPEANRLIDDYRRHHLFDTREYEYVEHESGPELLLYFALGVSVLQVTKSAIDLVTAILKARSEGRKKGDNQHGPLVIVVRGFDPNGAFYEKEILKADLEAPPARSTVERCLTSVIQQVAEERARQHQARDPKANDLGKRGKQTRKRKPKKKGKSKRKKGVRKKK